MSKMEKTEWRELIIQYGVTLIKSINMIILINSDLFMNEILNELDY